MKLRSLTRRFRALRRDVVDGTGWTSRRLAYQVAAADGRIVTASRTTGSSTAPKMDATRAPTRPA